MTESNRKPDTVGWYVDVPAELKRRFDELYPHKGAMKLITIAAIRYAIEQGEKNVKTK